MPETLEKQPTVSVKLTIKDFQSDQDVRWCPGCGDYSILAQVQRVLPEFTHKKENYVMISGIGCSSPSLPRCSACCRSLLTRKRIM